MRPRLAAPLVLALASSNALVSAAQSPPPGVPARPPRIEDNSFLLEEAYNQEARVVQHISGLDVLTRSGTGWVYSFTQEWPLSGQTHQLSYSIPVTHGDPGSGVKFQDIALNYRYQLVDGQGSRVAVAPRLSAILPTGNANEGRGAGGLGMQFNFPVSLELADQLVAHTNLGGTLTPSGRNRLGQRATTRDFNAGQSLVWLLAPTVNFLVEVAWNSTEDVIAPGRRARSESLVVSPGVRGALNFRSGLQIVPGFALPIGVGPSAGERRVFVYLSFEHPY